jgi:superfamily II DNA or RNA helicase
MVNVQKEKIQQEAYEAWVANGKIGTVEQATGTGKTFVAFKCILSMPKGSNILFLAETVVREATVLADAKQYKKFYGVDPLKGYKFKFATYQGAYKYTLLDYFPTATPQDTIVVMDEIHDILSDKRIEFVNNSMIVTMKNPIGFQWFPKVGLSATIDRKTQYLIQGQEITKFDLLKTFCPVVYTYSLQESMDNKTTRELRFFVLNHELDSITKNIESGAAGAKFMSTEKAKYPYLDRAVREAMFRKYKSEKEKKDSVMRIATTRARFLYTLPSKVTSCKALLPYLKGRTLVFGKDSKSLLQICPTSIVAENPNYIQDLADFKLGKTNIASANRILKQGENVPLLSNVILTAYYSKPTDFQQIIGRLRSDMLEGNVIIYRTKNSQEEKWFDSMIVGMKIDFIYCDSINQLVSKL